MAGQPLVHEAAEIDPVERPPDGLGQPRRIAAEEAPQEEVVAHREMQAGAAAPATVGLPVDAGDEHRHVVVAAVARDDERPRLHREPGPERPDAVALERPSSDPRELEALRMNVEQLHREASDLFEQLSFAKTAHDNVASRLE